MEPEEYYFKNAIGLASELHTHINAILSGEGFIDFLTIIFERELGQSKEEMSVTITSKNKEEIRIPLYIKGEKKNKTIYYRNPTLIKLLAQDNSKPFGDDIIIQVGNRSYEINNDNYLQLYTRRNNIVDDLLKNILIQRTIGKQSPTQQDIIELIVDIIINTCQERVDKIKLNNNKSVEDICNDYLRKQTTFEIMIKLLTDFIDQSLSNEQRKVNLKKQLESIEEELKSRKISIETIFKSYSNNELSFQEMVKKLLESIDKLSITDDKKEKLKIKLEKAKSITEKEKEEEFKNDIEKRLNDAILYKIVQEIKEIINLEIINEYKDSLKITLEDKRDEIKLGIINKYKSQTIPSKKLIIEVVNDIAINLNGIFTISAKEDPYILLPKYEETRTLIMIEYLLAILKEMKNNGKVKYAEISTRNPDKVPAWPDTKLPIVYFFLFQFPHNYEIDKIIEEYVKTDRRFIGIDFAGTELAVNPQEVTKRLDALFEKLKEANNKRHENGQPIKDLSVLRIHAAEFAGMNNNALNYLRGIDGLSPKRKELLPEIRIGHAIKLPVDKKDREEYIRLLKKYDVTIEINPSSNFLLKNISNYHELAKVIHFYLSNGIKLVVSTDGQGIYGTDLQQEFQKTKKIIDICVRYLVITELVKMNKKREENNKWTPEEIKEAADMILREMVGDIVFTSNDKVYHLLNDNKKLKRILAFQKSLGDDFQQNSLDDIEDIKEKIGKKNDNIDSINYKFPKEETGKSENANDEKSKPNDAYLAWRKSKNIEKGLSEQEKALAEAMNSLLEETNENNDSSNKGKKH